jgi:hypothetical protein
VYLLAEVSVNEEEIHATIESEILEAERSIKKRKGVDLEKAANEKVPALQDKKAKGNDDKKSTAAASDSTLVMDLVTDSESEGQGKKNLSVHHKAKHKTQHQDIHTHPLIILHQRLLGPLHLFQMHVYIYPYIYISFMYLKKMINKYIYIE